MVVSGIKNVLPKRDGYNYMQDAAAWVKKYNKENKSVFYDETRVRYYLNEPFIKNQKFNWVAVSSAVEDNSIKKYDILMISYSKEQPDHEVYIAKNLVEYKELARFNQTNKKNLL